MSETGIRNRRCPKVIFTCRRTPYRSSRRSGEPGVAADRLLQQGPYGRVHLLADTYWGGSISGDKVTVYWEDDCKCG